MNHYDRVAYLMPENGITDIIEDFLGIMTRFKVLDSPDFMIALEKVNRRDPEIIDELITPSNS